MGFDGGNWFLASKFLYIGPTDGFPSYPSFVSQPQLKKPSSFLVAEPVIFDTNPKQISEVKREESDP